MTILGIGSHPDDLELQCFGTLAKFKARGDEVFTCSASSGCYGHYEIMPDKLAEMRCQEAADSAQVIGAQYFSLGADDLGVDSSDKKLQRKLTDIIRIVDPDLIITHSDNDYMRDHIETFRLAEYASFAATIPHFETEHKFTKNVVPIYMMDNYLGVNFAPTDFVDITDFIEIKKQALRCHKTQQKWLKDHDDSEYVENMVLVSKFRGLQSGVKYAEAFRVHSAGLRLTTSRLLP